MTTTTPKLNQVLAIEKGVKQRAYSVLTEANKAVQKSAAFNGFSKIYQPHDGDGETLPPETVRVQNTTQDTLAEVQKALVELFDVTLSKDVANLSSVADVRLDSGTVIATRVPATNLLFLEKQLVDLKTFVANLPELDPAESWTFDNNASLYKSEPTVRYDAVVPRVGASISHYLPAVGDAGAKHSPASIPKRST